MAILHNRTFLFKVKHVCVWIIWLVSLVTTRKLSLGQGNIFTGVCHFFCPQGEGVGFPACISGQMSGGGVCIQGEVGQTPHLNLDGGRYACYWNAFLCNNVFALMHMNSVPFCMQSVNSCSTLSFKGTYLKARSLWLSVI